MKERNEECGTRVEKKEEREKEKKKKEERKRHGVASILNACFATESLTNHRITIIQNSTITHWSFDK